MDYAPLTHFQYRQLLHLKLEGSFAFRDETTGKKVPAPAWRKMIDALAHHGFIDEHASITAAGITYLDGINQQVTANVNQILGVA